jgi:hypothetical protein
VDALGAVQRQLEAYNERNLDKFLDLFTDDVQVEDLNSGKLPELFVNFLAFSKK